MERPSVDLPQPDSPTTPSVRPSLRSKLTLLTAVRKTGGLKRPLAGSSN
jgi:hypothetical protein